MSKILYSKFSYCEPHTARKIWVRRYGVKGSSRIFVLYPTYSKNILEFLTQNFLTVNHTQQENFEYENMGKRGVPEYFYYIPHIAKIFWNCYSKYSYYDPYIARILRVTFLLSPPRSTITHDESKFGIFASTVWRSGYF